jgi:hypothetical protein
VNTEDAARGSAAAISVARSLGLRVDETVVLSNSNRLVLRLLPSDVVVRVASEAHFASAALEIELATQLAGCPIAGIDPRVPSQVFLSDDFEITFWEHFELAPARTVPAAEYVGALVSLHAGLRSADLAAPHVRDRIVSTLVFVASRDDTPDLAEEDRALLTRTMRDLGESIVGRAAVEQLLHGEPHPWNLLDTNRGVRFIDFENASVGPLEYDLAWVPDDVAGRYPGVDQALLRDCRAVVLAVIAAHRWRRDDRHPSGRRSGHAFLDALRHGPPWPTLDQITW